MIRPTRTGLAVGAVITLVGSACASSDGSTSSADTDSMAASPTTTAIEIPVELSGTVSERTDRAGGVVEVGVDLDSAYGGADFVFVRVDGDTACGLDGLAVGSEVSFVIDEATPQDAIDPPTVTGFEFGC